MNTFRVSVTNEILRREMEKEEIRREIIAGEIARRRRELEDEVMREMALERALGIPMHRHLIAPYSFQERAKPFAADDYTNSIIGLETKPSSSSYSQVNKDKVIMLPRPDPNLHSAKRKAATPDLATGPLDKPDPNLDSAKQKAEALAICGTKPSEFVMKKKLKGEWSCPLCQIRVTNERGLKEHMHGRKHKNKEAALRRTHIIVKSTETSLLSNENEKGVKTTETLGDINYMMVDDSIGASELQLPQIVTPVEIKTPQIDKDKAIILAKCDPDLHKANGKAVAPDVNTTTRSSEFNLIIKPKEDWSCAICRISTSSKRNLSDHLHNKKHKAKEAALRNQEVLKSTEASKSLKESEKSVKTTEIILIPTPGLDAKTLEQFPQPSITLESHGILADSSPKESPV